MYMYKYMCIHICNKCVYIYMLSIYVYIHIYVIYIYMCVRYVYNMFYIRYIYINLIYIYMIYVTISWGSQSQGWNEINTSLTPTECSHVQTQSATQSGPVTFAQGSPFGTSPCWCSPWQSKDASFPFIHRPCSFQTCGGSSHVFISFYIPCSCLNQISLIHV